MTENCYICFSDNVFDVICDDCENYYCEDCSYTFSIHYQYQGSRCFKCSDQPRRKALTKEYIRDNKIKLIICQKEF